MATRFTKALIFTLACLGIFPVSNPLSNLAQMKFRHCSIYVLISLVYIIVPIVIFTDVIVSNSPQVLAESDALSKKILVFTLVPINCLTNTIIRLSFLCYCQQILELLRSGESVWKALRRTNLVVLQIDTWKILFIVAHTIVVLFSTSGIIVARIFTQHPNAHGLAYQTLPESGIFRSTIIAMLSITNLFAFGFAGTFIIVGGAMLLVIQDGMQQLLLVHLKKKNTLDRGRWASQSFRSAPVGLFSLVHYYPLNFPSLYKVVRGMFEVYQEIAGWMLLSMVMMGVLETIRAFGILAIDQVKVERSMSDFLEGVSIVCLMSCFAEYFQSSVKQAQRNVLDQCAMRMEPEDFNPIVRWYLQWNVQLSAKNFFPLTHKTILQATATVVTYFIFIFQLSQSESTPKLLNACQEKQTSG